MSFKNQYIYDCIVKPITIGLTWKCNVFENNKFKKRVRPKLY